MPRAIAGDKFDFAPAVGRRVVVSSTVPENFPFDGSGLGRVGDDFAGVSWNVEFDDVIRINPIDYAVVIDVSV